LLGTEIKVRSAPGQGSVFSLRLPGGEGNVAPDRAHLAPDAAQGRAAAFSVLVVDDDALVLASNRALLEDMGCEVTTVPDGKGALSALADISGKPVLVLCDLWLSDHENGIDLLRRLSTMTAARVSGILISGDTRPESVAAAKAAGFPLLHKPVAPAKLRAVVMQFAWRMRESNAELLDEDSPG
jgi:CheY-like chemotaxis protein